MKRKKRLCCVAFISCSLYFIIQTSLCESDEGLGLVRVCSRVLWWTESWAGLSWATGNSDLRICSVCVSWGSLFREEYKRVRERLAPCYVAPRQSSGVMGLVCVRWGECILWLYLSIQPSISLP